MSEGIAGLRLKYKGAKPLLNVEEKEEILKWLQQKNYWDLKELYSYILTNYNVTFKSKQSYYDLFKEAGISWKKSQKKNPKRDPELVKKKGRNNRKVIRMESEN
nr:winged helix-turn-helix domain-containing protein [Anaplasma marginale]